MERILIIGGCGSGKTTFAKALSEKINLPLIHLDKIYWKDNWQHISRVELAEILQPFLENDKWIIDGNMLHSLPHRIKYCDTVIYFDFPAIVCVYGAIKRIVKWHNKSRPDMGGKCLERFDRNSFEFIKSIFNFNKRNRSNFYDSILKEKDINLIVLKNRKQVKNFLESCT